MCGRGRAREGCRKGGRVSERQRGEKRAGGATRDDGDVQETYKGKMKQGLRDGEGTCEWPNGENFVGGWLDGKR